MIRRDENDGWVLITQHDHAGLAGRVMEYWGTDSFSEPGGEVIFAIREHDSGWKEWDALPKLNPDTGYPANFMEMESKDQSEIWTRCYKAHAGEHPYASSLIALHFAKFNQESIEKDPADKNAVALKRDLKHFVADKLGIEIENSTPGDIPSEVKMDLKLLKIGDIMSLTLCCGWKSIEITDVPLDYSGKSDTLKMESPDGLNYIIAPYPFSEPLLSFGIECRRLGRKIFSNDNEYREILESTEYETLDFTIRKV